MSRSYISSPPSAFMACSGTDLAFYKKKELKEEHVTLHVERNGKQF
jgi:hypothetical protein